jgi:predicted  nucleic acid-binding Zn-ribbon protein
MKPDWRRNGPERMWRGRESLEIIEGKAVELDTEALNLGVRLTELLAEESPEELLRKLQAFKRSVEDALARSSSAFQILRQLDSAGLKECARCTEELEQRLSRNAHYRVLGKLAEAEQIIAELTNPAKAGTSKTV